MSAQEASPARVLVWCLAGALVVQLGLWYFGWRGGFSAIFYYFLRAHETHGNAVLAIAAVLAFLLRHRQAPLALVRFAGERPWTIAALTFPLLCWGSLQVYEAYPLSMDEYSTYFQGQAFAAGELRGKFPPDLLDRLVPGTFQGWFFSVSRATGEVATTYWPSFSLFLAPFFWVGAPWAANPLLAALAIPAVHGIARDATGSQEAAGWAVLLALASPAFIVTSVSFYTMPAHLLCGLWYARLLLAPTPRRAALAGVVGSIALTLHFPLRHVAFAAPFVLWLLLRPGAVRHAAALIAGYVPLGLLLGWGWHAYVLALPTGAAAAASAAASAAAEAAPGVAQAAPPGGTSSYLVQVLKSLGMPSIGVVHARLAELAVLWNWAAAGLVALAIHGAALSWRSSFTRVLLATFGTTLLGYLLTGTGDQGHGWGNRPLYGVWFVLPLLAAVALARAPLEGSLRGMVGWAAVLSLVLANGLRLLQVDAFVERHLAQVPPLARAPDPSRPEVVFVNVRSGFYTYDMIHNDPFLRGPRIVMVLGTQRSAESLMAVRFPAYRKAEEGAWGQRWERGAGR